MYYCNIVILYYCNTKTKTKQKATKYASTNSRRHGARETKSCTLASNIWGSSARNLIHFVHLALTILRRFQDTGKFITPNDDDDNDGNRFIHWEVYSVTGAFYDQD